jgi:DNA-binding PadR family transcriptional regulator
MRFHHSPFAFFARMRGFEHYFGPRGESFEMGCSPFGGRGGRSGGRGGRGEHGGGPFGFGGPGGGAGGFGRGDFAGGRKFGSDDLQLMLLDLLAEAPRHGYELIKALEQRSGGVYTPSPGMVYPALTYLEELGYATVETEGNRKRYSLSGEGRAYLEQNRERLDLVNARLNLFAKKMEMVRRALSGESADEHGSPWLAELIEARRAVKRALVHHADTSEAEQRRIAAILRRAAQEIENPPKAQGSDEPGNAKE